MSLANAAETALLELLFNNEAWANVGDASGLQPSASDGVFYISLHTADPTETGDQEENEISYTGYARVAVARTTGGWTVTGNTVENAAEVEFPQSSGGTGGDTNYFGIGTASTGPGNLILSGQNTQVITVANGIQPRYSAGELTVTAE